MKSGKKNYPIAGIRLAVGGQSRLFTFPYILRVKKKFTFLFSFHGIAFLVGQWRSCVFNWACIVRFMFYFNVYNENCCIFFLLLVIVVNECRVRVLYANYYVKRCLFKGFILCLYEFNYENYFFSI